MVEWPNLSKCANWMFSPQVSSNDDDTVRPSNYNAEKVRRQFFSSCSLLNRESQRHSELTESLLKEFKNYCSLERIKSGSQTETVLRVLSRRGTPHSSVVCWRGNLLHAPSSLETSLHSSSGIEG
jgi:hypothetical protein